MPELLNKLAEREKERLAAELDARAMIRAVADQVNKSAEELMELRRAQEQELRVLRAQWEKRIRDTAYACRQKVHKANSELGEADALADRGEERQRVAEARLHDLTNKLASMRAHIEHRSENAQANVASLERMMSVRAERTAAQCQTRVQQMTEHAQFVQRSCRSALGCVEGELSDQMARAQIRAEARVRFKELCDLAQRTAKYDLSTESYHHCKAELISLWQMQKTTHSPHETLRLLQPGQKLEIAPS